MTTAPHDLATKRPARTATILNTERMPNGQFRAVRGGTPLPRLLVWIATSFLLVGFAGYMLSTLSQGG